jgi:RHS repeat-associated protein
VSLCYHADFYPFGGERIVTNTCPQNYKFTGKERDSESGLDNFGARFDSSTLGRFMTPDELLVDQHLGDPQTWNLYPYVRNNALEFVDESRNGIKYAAGLKNADDVEDIVNAILKDPDTRSELSGYVGANNPDLTITTGDLSKGDHAVPWLLW